jgi:hypothetical protein
MDGEQFDRLTKRLFGGSRRRFVRALLFAATAIPLTPVRIAKRREARSTPITRA